jgi:hypothetical protein
MLQLVSTIHNIYKNQMLNYSWVIFGDMFRPLNGHPQANLEQYCQGTVKIVFWLYLNNIVLSFPEDGNLTAETCPQVYPSCN